MEKEERSNVREAQIPESKLKKKTPSEKTTGSAPKAWAVGDLIEAEYEVRWVGWGGAQWYWSMRAPPNINRRLKSNPDLTPGSQATGMRA